MECKSLALHCITFIVVWTVVSLYAIYLGNQIEPLTRRAGMKLQVKLTPTKLKKIFAIRLESEAEEIYAKAIEALESSDEERAQKLLLERDNVQEKLKVVLETCATA